MILLFLIILFFVSYLVFFSLNNIGQQQDTRIVYLSCVLVVSSLIVLYVKKQGFSTAFSPAAYFSLSIGPLLFVLLGRFQIKLLLHFLPLVIFVLIYGTLRLFAIDTAGLYHWLCNEMLFFMVMLSTVCYGNYGYLYTIRNHTHIQSSHLVITYIILNFCSSFLFGVMLFSGSTLFDIEYCYIVYCLIVIAVACVEQGKTFFQTYSSNNLTARSVRESYNNEKVTLQHKRGVNPAQEQGDKTEKIEAGDLVKKLKAWEKSLARNQRNMEIRQKLFIVLIETKLYLDMELTLSCLIKLVGVSRVDLNRYFKDSNAVGFKMYINRLRVEYAVKLIQESNDDLSIEELSSMCGFSSRLAFYRAFVSVYGFAPSSLMDVKGRK